MTPTEQDKELEKAVWASLASQMTHAINCTDPEHKRQDSCVDFTEKNFEQLMQLITADRKRVALEARINENESLARSVHENTGARGGANIKGFNTAVRYYRENIQGRIVELKTGARKVMSKQQLDNVQQLNPKTGQWEDVPPTPFYVRTWLGKWLPVCTKHKLIFKDDANYYHHERYNDCDGGEALISDHKRHLVGYKMAKS